MRGGPTYCTGGYSSFATHSSMSKVAHGIGQTKYHDDREENIVGTTEKLRDNLEQCLKEGRCDEKLRCAQTVMTFP